MVTIKRLNHITSVKMFFGPTGGSGEVLSNWLQIYDFALTKADGPEDRDLGTLMDQQAPSSGALIVNIWSDGGTVVVQEVVKSAGVLYTSYHPRCSVRRVQRVLCLAVAWGNATLAPTSGERE